MYIKIIFADTGLRGKCNINDIIRIKNKKKKKKGKKVHVNLGKCNVTIPTNYKN